MDLKCYLLYLNQLTHKYYVKKPLQNVMDTLANVISKNTSIVLQQFNQCHLVLHQHGASNPNESSQEIMIINAAK